MRKFIIILLICCAGAVWAQEKATEFTLKNFDGQDVSLSDFKGKVVILEWWATWCTKCRHAFPEIVPFFNKLSKEHGETDLAVAAINIDKKKPEKIARFVKKTGIEYLTLLDPEAATGKGYNLKMLPLIIVIDKEGNIAKKFQGHKKKKTVKEIEQLVLELVKG